MVDRKVEEKWAIGQQGPDHEGPTGSGLNPPNFLTHKVSFSAATWRCCGTLNRDFSNQTVWGHLLPDHLTGLALGSNRRRDVQGLEASCINAIYLLFSSSSITYCTRGTNQSEVNGNSVL